jgi:uncharacterized protein (DUF1684 family)
LNREKAMTPPRLPVLREDSDGGYFDSELGSNEAGADDSVRGV